MLIIIIWYAQHLGHAIELTLTPGGCASICYRGAIDDIGGTDTMDEGAEEEYGDGNGHDANTELILEVGSDTVLPGGETSKVEDVVGAEVELELRSCWTRVRRTWMNSSSNKLDNGSGGAGAEPEPELTEGLLTPAKLMPSCPEVVEGGRTTWAAELEVEAVIDVGNERCERLTVEYGRLDKRVVPWPRPAPLRGIEEPAL